MRFQKRLFWCSLLFLLALLGVPLLLAGLHMQQEQRDQALIFAVQAQNGAAVRKLLQAGASPNARVQNRPKRTFRQHRMNLFDTLRGRKPEDPAGSSALMLAVVKDNTEIVLALLAQGAMEVHSDADFSTDPAYPHRMPLLSGAARNGNRIIVQALLDRGAYIDTQGANGETALIVAASELPTYYTYREETKAPSEAACKTHTAVVRLLLDRGANVHARKFRGKYSDETALILAGRYNELDTIKLLLSRGANVNEAAGGVTALMLSALYGDPPTLRYLLRRGADVNARSDDGRTALMYAAEDGEDENIEVLLEAGANPNRTDAEGKTALMWAAEDGNDEAVRLLLEAGAKINARDKSEQTALGHAIAEDNTDVIRLLRKAGGKK